MTHANMSEAQEIEFNRRNDIAYALLPSAAYFLGLRDDLARQVKDKKRRSASPWYWIFGVAGIALHYAFAPAEAKISGWFLVSVASYGLWMTNSYQERQLQERQRECAETLMSIAAKWAGATGQGSFWEIAKFVDEGSIDHTREGFRDWWLEQGEAMRHRCGASGVDRTWATKTTP